MKKLIVFYLCYMSKFKDDYDSDWKRFGAGLLRTAINKVSDDFFKAIVEKRFDNACDILAKEFYHRYTLDSGECGFSTYAGGSRCFQYAILSDRKDLLDKLCNVVRYENGRMEFLLMGLIRAWHRLLVCEVCKGCEKLAESELDSLERFVGDGMAVGGIEILTYIVDDFEKMCELYGESEFATKLNLTILFLVESIGSSHLMPLMRHLYAKKEVSVMVGLLCIKHERSLSEVRDEEGVGGEEMDC